MKRVLIAMPIKGGIESVTLSSLIPLLRSGLPGYDFDFMISDGPAIPTSRNDIAHKALAGGFDELVMIDKDIIWNVDKLVRLLSHDLDIVGGAYCRHRPGPCSWLFIPVFDAKETETRLLECSALATGFMRIRVSALRRIAAFFPDLRYASKGNEGNEEYRLQHEFFGIGLAGPGSAEGRLDDIRKLIVAGGTIEQMREAAFGERCPSGLIGEDYRFCMRARQAGLRVWVDFGLDIMPHFGLASYPITEDMVGYHDKLPLITPRPDYFLENYGVPQPTIEP